MLEHILHSRDAADVPCADVLIEHAGAHEHTVHVRDVADVPRADVLIERTGVIEHIARLN